MHEICPGRLTPEVTRLLNEKFGTNYTKAQIGGVRERLGLPVGKIYQGKLLTKEQHDYLVSIQKNKISRDVAKEMKDGRDIEAEFQTTEALSEQEMTDAICRSNKAIIN